MEDARYRARQVVGLEAADTAADLVSAVAEDVLFEYIVRHQAIELCLLGIDYQAAVTGPVTPGNEAVIRVDRIEAGQSAAEDMEVYFATPLGGVTEYTSPPPTVCDRNTNQNEEPDYPKFYRGDRLRIVVEQPGTTTAQAGRPWVAFREIKYGRQEGPS